jgi:ATP/maltotriose-dependent transcriptional regulator MalT
LHLEFARPLCLAPLVAADIGLRQFATARENLFRLSEYAESSADPYLELSARILELKLHASDGRPRVASESEELPDATVHAGSRGEFLALLALESAVQGDSQRALRLAKHARETASGAEAKYYSWAAELSAVLRDSENTEALIEEGVRFVSDAEENEVLDAIVLGCRADPGIATLVTGNPAAQRIVARAMSASRDRALAEKVGARAPAVSRMRPESVLTNREVQVLELLGRGLSNAEIARELVITLSTTKVHVHHVLKKLGVATRLQAGLRANDLTDRTSRRHS